MENKNGQGIFYGVIGVATLVVAIIGATFAYFNAAATTNYVNNIEGGTLDLTGSALSISVTKVVFTGATADSPNLVPATITNSNGTPTAAGITQALGAKCEKNGYTGCHVYKIEASSATEVTSAQINLATLTTTASANKSDWKYAIFTGSESSASTVVNSGNMDLAAPVNMHSSVNTLNSSGVTYYLIIYLAEDNDTTAQNSGGANDATGTYTGTVTLTAGGGSVTANFAA